MRNAEEIYAAYRIMPSLQLHQLRVAAAGKIICDNFSGTLDANSAILACLFHDMGNIIKSDLVTFPDFLEPEGFEYWKGVKDEYEKKYGNDEHHATLTIAKEAGLPEPATVLIDGVGFSKLEIIRKSPSFEQKIVEYCDTRVAPRGVSSMTMRLEDARKRYAGRTDNNDIPEARERYDRYIEAAREIEQQIFARCSIKPEDINDTSVAPLIEELRNYPVA